MSSRDLLHTCSCSSDDASTAAESNNSDPTTPNTMPAALKSTSLREVPSALRRRKSAMLKLYEQLEHLEEREREQQIMMQTFQVNTPQRTPETPVPLKPVEAEKTITYDLECDSSDYGPLPYENKSFYLRLEGAPICAALYILAIAGVTLIISLIIVFAITKFGVVQTTGIDISRLEWNDKLRELIVTNINSTAATLPKN